MTVAADGQTRIGVVYNERDTDMRRNHCRVAVQFNAQAGARYLAHFTRNDAGQCGPKTHADAGIPRPLKAPNLSHAHTAAPQAYEMGDNAGQAWHLQSSRYYRSLDPFSAHFFSTASAMPVSPPKTLSPCCER